MKMKTKEGVRKEEWEKVVMKVQGWLEGKGSQYRNRPVNVGGLFGQPICIEPGIGIQVPWVFKFNLCFLVHIKDSFRNNFRHPSIHNG